jgi:hypothetical protein
MAALVGLGLLFSTAYAAFRPMTHDARTGAPSTTAADEAPLLSAHEHSGTASSIQTGSANVGTVVLSFDKPTWTRANEPVSFDTEETIRNDGPDPDQVVLVTTLKVPDGCQGQIDSSLTMAGPDTAVIFGTVPVSPIGEDLAHSESITIECSAPGFHTFVFRKEVEPLFATDPVLENNEAVISFTVCDVTDSNGDTDQDGLTNGQELALGSDPCNSDTDEDGLLDAADNCPLVQNPDQINSDSGPPPPAGNTGAIGNGPGIPGDDATVPNGDSLGDACDPDKDNDGLLDVDEDPLNNCGQFDGLPANHPNPVSGDITYNDNGDLIMLGPGDNGPSWDTDGDVVPDGVECALATNPRQASGSDRAACWTFAGPGDSDGDGLDNTWEVCKWGTDPNRQDTDGDGRGDCTEVMDVNGNGFVTVSDAVLIRQAVFGVIGEDGDFDINANRIITNVDAVLVQQAYFGVRPCH